MTNALENIRNQLEQGVAHNKVTVRQFLSWFNAKRRGPYIVEDIRKKLKECNLITLPDFESAYIDSEIEIKLIADQNINLQSISENQESDLSNVGSPTISQTPDISALQVENITESFFLSTSANDPTYKISKLKVAVNGVVSVKPEDSLRKTLSLMLINDFSQVPVMSNSREVKGVVSWKSLGAQIFLKNMDIQNSQAKDCMEEAQILPIDSSIFEAVQLILSNDYVLTRGPDRTIQGIVTATDLSVQFRDLSEPFLLLSEIENTLRILLHEKFSIEDFKSVNDGTLASDISSIDDLNFGDYRRLLEYDQNWQKFQIPMDRTLFCHELEGIRKIRNSVMHFDPDGIEDDELDLLRRFGRFLRVLKSACS